MHVEPTQTVDTRVAIQHTGIVFFGGPGSRLALGLILATLFAQPSHGTARGVRDAPPSMIDPEVRRAVGEGAARVLVELRLPVRVTPEGDLARPEAVAAQRRAIATAQGSVLSRLSGTHFALLRRYESVAFLVLEIHTDALIELERMGDIVARVLVDSTRAPAARPGAAR